jgi:hypothetical protein
MPLVGLFGQGMTSGAPWGAEQRLTVWRGRVNSILRLSEDQTSGGRAAGVGRIPSHLA